MSGGKRSPSIAPLSLLRRGRDGGRVGERGSEGPHAHLSGRCCCAERRGGRQTHGKYWSRVKYSYSTRARAGFQSHKLGTRKHTRACTHKPPVPRESLGKIRGAEGWALERGRDAEREEEGRSGAQGKMLFSRWQAPSPCPLSLSVFHMLSLPSGSVYYVCTPFFSAPSFSPMPPLVRPFCSCWLFTFDSRSSRLGRRSTQKRGQQWSPRPLFSKVFSQVQMCVVML